MKNTSRENLTEHSLDCAVVAHALGLISVKIFGQTDVNPEKCAVIAMYHDSPETLTGDLPTPIKYFNPEIASAYEKVEISAKNKLISMIDEKLSEDYRDILYAEGIEAELVHYADKISAYIKCLEEIKAGNKEFKIAKKQILKTIEKISHPAVGYFMKNYIGAFEATLDELE